MDIDLNKLGTARQPDAYVWIFFGGAGIGKTSLAGSFPAPVVMPVEDGSSVLEGTSAKIMPQPTTTEQAAALLNAIRTQKHPYKTLIIDSINALISIRETEIVSGDPNARSLAQALGGYGAGVGALVEFTEQLAKGLARLSRKGIHVVMIAHPMIEKVTPPDSQIYDRWNIAGYPKAVDPIIRHSDFVGLLRLETAIVKDGGGGDRSIATSSDLRELVCHAHPGMVTKNRFGIAHPIRIALDPATGYVVNPFGAWLQAPVPEPQKAPSQASEEPAATQGPVQEDLANQEPGPASMMKAIEEGGLRGEAKNK